MSPMKTYLGFGALALGIAAASVAACDSSDNTVHDTTPANDSGTPPGTDSSTNNPDTSQPAVDSAPPPGLDCFPNPTTHDEIINACTDAQKFDKTPNLPKLLADGGLPPLP